MNPEASKTQNCCPKEPWSLEKRANSSVSAHEEMFRTYKEFRVYTYRSSWRVMVISTLFHDSSINFNFPAVTVRDVALLLLTIDST